MPPTIELIAAGLILAFGAAVQMAVGFGIGLVAVPLLLWSGRTLPEAVALVLGASIVQTGYGTWLTRTKLEWGLAFRIACAQWLVLPLGLLGMYWLVGRDQRTVKQVVGIFILVLISLRLFFRPRPRERLAAAWKYVAGGSAGFLAGLIGMGGPPLVFYALAHDWGKDRFRGFLWSQFLLAVPFMVTALSIVMGVHVLGWFLFGACLTPLIWLGARGGLAITSRWNARHLQLAATLLLYAIGLSAAIGPLLF